MYDKCKFVNSYTNGNLFGQKRYIKGSREINCKNREPRSCWSSTLDHKRNLISYKYLKQRNKKSKTTGKLNNMHFKRLTIFRLASPVFSDLQIDVPSNLNISS